MNRNIELPLVASADYLSIEGLAKRFGAFVALKQISLNVKKGELLCLLGPSGCGKTTLLRMIAGLEFADAGAITVEGKDITRLPAAKRDYGIVFQSYALFPNLNVADNIAYGLKGRSSDKAARVTSLLELIGLAGIEDKYPAQLSGGQQQRVALARALATSPGLLLLDEPLSALDARVREHLRREIRNLQQRLGITTILVTHDQDEALTMADRIVVMNHGVIEQVGTPEEIYSHPQSRFVAEFVGKSNWIKARVTGNQCLSVADVELYALHLPPLPLGQEVELFIRPEAVRLHATWDVALLREPNTALADVSKMELLGSFYRISLHVPVWNVDLMVDLSRDQLALYQPSLTQRIPVSLPHDQLRVFCSKDAA